MAETDQEIIRHILEGEQLAYGRLIDRHKDRAMTLAMRLLKNREEAEEAVQDAFVRAFRALGRFEWRSSFSTWLYRIVFNVCSSVLRERGEDLFVPLDHQGMETTFRADEVESRPDVRLESSELRHVVAEEIRRLPPGYSGILTLFLIQDMSYDQIVEVTGFPLGTVKTRLFRARALLQEAVRRRYGRKKTIVVGKVITAL